MEGSIDAILARFIHLIETKYISTPDTFRPIEFGERSAFFTLDVVTELAYGKAFGYLEEDKDLFDYLKILKGAAKFAQIMGEWPILADILHSKFSMYFLSGFNDGKFGFGPFKT
jgi:hypothetical protein